jgi:ubiquinone/menaquinone biosynthesis C-methylase UbiE
MINMFSRRGVISAAVLVPLAIACVTLCCGALGTQTQKPAPQQAGPKYDFFENHDPDGIGKFYMGREIAQVMGHQAADWLDRPEREAEEAPTLLIKSLRLKPGMTVADIGAGSGYLTFPMAKLVAPTGKVYAEEIQQEMLDIIEKRMKERKVTNIVSVLGTIKDTKLPENSTDLILLVDVYHEFDFPWEMTRSMVKALKPGGRLVFVEYREEDPNVPIKPVHKMSEKQVKKEMSVHALKWQQTIRVLPRQHIIIFTKQPATSK